jgi:hypothetical protein
MLQFLMRILNFLNGNNIEYMLSGSVAMSIYVEPRATRDLDFVVNLSEANVSTLINHFGSGYYCATDAVYSAVKEKGMFNIIDHASGFKADFIVLKDSDFRQTEFGRRQQADFFGVPIYVVSLEDLLISKLIWIQELQSEIQKNDIKVLAEVDHLDRNYIQQWVRTLKLNTFDLI